MIYNLREINFVFYRKIVANLWSHHVRVRFICMFDNSFINSKKESGPIQNACLGCISIIQYSCKFKINRLTIKNNSWGEVTG